MTTPRLATLWLDGCSGCHMSLLDTDERLLDLAARVEIVYSPLVDQKDFPEQVDIVCIEGAVSTDEDEARLCLARQRARRLIAMGDCAITGNIPALRNPTGARTMLQAVYQTGPDGSIPADHLPVLHDRALPLHHFVSVDLFIPGCPPSADALYAALDGLIGGTALPGLKARFGR